VRTQNKCPFVTSHLLFYLAQVNIDTVNIVKVVNHQLSQYLQYQTSTYTVNHRVITYVITVGLQKEKNDS